MPSHVQQRNVALFGASGQLGSAIAGIVPSAIRIPWSLAEKWQQAEIRAWLKNLARQGKADVIVANGITDPSRSAPELERSNHLFPAALLAAGRDYPDLRFLTIGSVMEAIPEMAERNRYIAGKRALSEDVVAAASTGMAGRVMHLRLHTLYGVGMPHEHMFLGQMFSSLCADRPFEMTRGRQYRQYHHAEDIAAAIARLLDHEWLDMALYQINGHETLRLREIAESVFEYFGRTDLLRVGTLPEPVLDVSEMPTYVHTDTAIFSGGRPALKGINVWLSECFDKVAADRADHHADQG